VPGITLFSGVDSGLGNLDGVGPNARFFAPTRLVVARDGMAYVVDSAAIRRVTPEGIVTTLAGNSFEPGDADGIGANASFNSILSIALHPAGDEVLVAQARSLRWVSLADGRVTTVPVLRPQGTDIFAQAIAVAPDGTVFLPVGLPGSLANRFPEATAIFTLAPGSSELRPFVGTVGARGNVDGRGDAVRFTSIDAMAFEADGALVVSSRIDNFGRSVLRRVLPDGTVSTFSGSTASISAQDGNASTAVFGAVTRLVPLPDGQLLALDGRSLRLVARDGSVTTLGGSQPGRGVQGVADVARDPAGGLLAAWPPAIAKFDAAYQLQLLAGVPPGPLAGFEPGAGLVADAQGNVFTVSDQGAAGGRMQRIRKYGASGERVPFGPGLDEVLVPAGVHPSDKTGYDQRGLAIDVNGNLYLMNMNNEAIGFPPFFATFSIYRVSPGGTVERLLDLPPGWGPPFAVTPSGSLLFADGGVQTIVRWRAGEIVKAATAPPQVGGRFAWGQAEMEAGMSTQSLRQRASGRSPTQAWTRKATCMCATATRCGVSPPVEPFQR
jgi:hypothetical protein